MVKFLLASTLVLAPAAAAFEPAFVAQSPILKPYDALCCGEYIQTAMQPDGSFWILWGGEAEPAKMRRFSPAGAPLTAELPLGLPGFTNMASRPGGGFVVMTSSGAGSQARVFDAAGNGGPVLELGPPTSSIGSAIELGPTGNFFVANSVGGPFPDLELRRFSADGTPLGVPRLVMAHEDGFSLGKVELAPGPDGGVAVFWEHRPLQGLTGAGNLHQRRYDAAGEPLGAAQALPVAEATETRATFAPDGRAILAYKDAGSQSSALGALAIDGQGQAAAPVAVSYPDWNLATTPDPAILANGDLALTTDAFIGDEWGVTIQLIRLRGGQPLGGRLQLMPPAYPYDFLAPRIASQGDRAVVVWHGRPFHPAAQSQVYFQVFEATLFADSFESGGAGAWTVVE